MEKKTDDTLRRETLLYLGPLPYKLQSLTPHSQALAEVCLKLGNFLRWTHSIIAPGEIEHEQPIHENAVTVYALAIQFQKLWRMLADGHTETRTPASVDVERIESRMASLEAWMLRSMASAEIEREAMPCKHEWSTEEGHWHDRHTCKRCGLVWWGKEKAQ